MEIGKVPNNMLEEIIFGKLKHNRIEVLLRPKIGEDCCAIDFGDNICVISSDPITGTVNEVGRLAVHVSCNDIASCGAEPVGIISTVLLPAGTTEKELDTLVSQMSEAAAELNVEIIGGHTEITTAVNRVVVTSTVLGKIKKDKLVTSSGARPGDSIILTKWAGLEGTAIIAREKEPELIGQIGKEAVDKAKDLINSISVVKEGLIAAEFGATAMHDVTEGGVLGALWEMAKASDVGIMVYEDKIPIKEETLSIAQYFGIDPLKLISSGCMLIACKDGGELVKKLENSGIKATIIGKATEEKKCLLVAKEGTHEIHQPDPDELYKVV
ncbi:MAG TPA: AIR synthase [Clostridiaceae bacterium]|nr:AIR synthase [Clostridiaceae bacterium]